MFARGSGRRVSCRDWLTRTGLISLGERNKSAKTEPDGASGSKLYFSVKLGARNHRGGRGRPSICHAGCGRTIPAANGKVGEGHLRFVGEFFPTDSKWRSL